MLLTWSKQWYLIHVIMFHLVSLIEMFSFLIFNNSSALSQWF